MDRLFSTVEVARLIGVTYRTLDQWITAGLLVLARQGRGRGKGRERMLDGRGILAAGVIRALRRQGASLAMLRPIGVFIGNTSVSTMQSAFEEGRTVLVSAGGRLPVRLVPPTGYAVNRTGGMTMVIVIDLEKVFSRVARIIEQTGTLVDDQLETTKLATGKPCHAT